MAIIWLFLLDDLPKSEIVLDYFISPQGGISHMACWKIHQPSFDDFPRYKCPFLGELDLWDIIYIYVIYIYLSFILVLYICVFIMFYGLSELNWKLTYGIQWSMFIGVKLDGIQWAGNGWDLGWNLRGTVVRLGWEINDWLVVQCAHLEKYEFVNGKDDIPYMKWKIKVMFETTNQIMK